MYCICFAENGAHKNHLTVHGSGGDLTVHHPRTVYMYICLRRSHANSHKTIGSVRAVVFMRITRT